MGDKRVNQNKTKNGKVPTVNRAKITNKRRSIRSTKSSILHVTPKTTIAELLAIPGMYEKLLKLGVPCVVCPIVGFEQAFLTLEGISKAYGLDLDKIIETLNSDEASNNKQDSL